MLTVLRYILKRPVFIVLMVCAVCLFSSHVFAADVAAVNVKDLGAKGDGITDDTAAIVKAVEAYREIIFPPGVYKVSSPLNFAKNGIRIRGIGKAEIYFVGTGRAVSFEGGAVDIGMENITIRGTAATTDGLYVRSCHHLNFQDIRVTDVSESAFRFDFTVLSNFKNLVASANEGGFRITPKYGLSLSRYQGENSTSNIFTNLIIEGVSLRGINIEYGDSNLFLGGTSEGNQGVGLVLESGALFNTFVNLVCGGNGQGNLANHGRGNQFINAKCTGQ